MRVRAEAGGQGGAEQGAFLACYDDPSSKPGNGGVCLGREVGKTPGCVLAPVIYSIFTSG